MTADPGDDKAVPAGRSRTTSLYVIPVLTALLAGGATYLGATIASDATLTTQREQIIENRQVVERNKRAEVYLSLLDKATEYAYAVDGAVACVERETAGRNGAAALSRECSANLAGISTPRSDFQRARNLVFVYGSQEAEDAAGLLAGTLPDAVGTLDGGISGRVDFDLFGERYRQFNRVMCRDVQTDPARRCE